MPALIPARGGSKGIPRKNLCALGGLPLVAHAIRNARAARSIGRVLVSTDSEEIREVALSEGAEALARPPELALDETPMREVLLHAFHALSAEGGAPGVLALLQPTSPFLRPETIDRAVAAFEAAPAAAVLKAVKRVREHPAWMLEARGGRLEPYLPGPPLRRQDLPELFIPCGALYLYRAAYLRAPDERAPSAWVELDWPESLDIDEPADLRVAAWVLEQGWAGGGGTGARRAAR